MPFAVCVACTSEHSRSCSNGSRVLGVRCWVLGVGSEVCSQTPNTQHPTPATASAASTVQPPRKTERRAEDGRGARGRRGERPPPAGGGAGGGGAAAPPRPPPPPHRTV